MGILRFFSVLVFIFCFAYGCGQKNEAPDFELFTAGERTQPLGLSKINADSQVLLAFWASWCPACVDEIPILNTWNEKFSDRGLKIIGVNVGEPRKDVEKFIKNHKILYPVVLDEAGEVADRYGIVGLPVTVLLAKGGEILYYGFALPPRMEERLS
ncbi:MAG: TlpA family protein disulfide reductase [Candidatus Omnitrophica bacterium]|nr:TlpA family protein disulfide reductase [Candidatus Omnitrophota bacterium]